MSALPEISPPLEPAVTPIWPGWKPAKYVISKRGYTLPDPARYPYLYRKLEATRGVWVYGLRDRVTGTPDEQIADLNRRIRRHRRAAVEAIRARRAS